MSAKVIAEPTGKLCDSCDCKCWCKAEWRIRYADGGGNEYVGCATRAKKCGVSLRDLFVNLVAQQRGRWSWSTDGYYSPYPLADYWLKEGRRKLPSGSAPDELDLSL